MFGGPTRRQLVRLESAVLAADRHNLALLFDRDVLNPVTEISRQLQKPPGRFCLAQPELALGRAFDHTRTYAPVRILRQPVECGHLVALGVWFVHFMLDALVLLYVHGRIETQPQLK